MISNRKDKCDKHRSIEKKRIVNGIRNRNVISTGKTDEKRNLVSIEERNDVTSKPLDKSGSSKFESAHT